MDKVIKNENRDHIYCNVKTRKDLPFTDAGRTNFIGDISTVKKMKNFILSNINLIEELQNQLQERDSLIAKLLAENEGLKQRLQRYKHSKTSSKKSDFQKDANNTNNSSGGNNNNVPANKNKASEKRISENALKDKRVSIDTSEDEIFNKKPSEDSQESISIKLSSKNLFMMTNKPYVINDWKICDLEDEEIQKGFDDINLEVPNWIEVDLPRTPPRDSLNLPTEDISDEAFQKRHQKYEIDERRRKKWDQQRIREQKNIERLRKRHLKEEYGETSAVAAKVPKVMNSFFPDIEAIKFIQISDDLPISAFGEQIPKLQPKDFSLPWLSEHDDNSNIYSIDQMCSNANPRMKVRTKFISRCMQSMSK
jgi:male-specific lethal 1